MVAHRHHDARRRPRRGPARPGAVVGAAWPYEAIGVAFGAVGLLLIAYAYVRQKRVDEALARGDYAPFDMRAGLLFASLGVLLAIATIVIIVAHPR